MLGARPYNPPMYKLLPLLCLLLSACGMKGDLYEPTSPATEPATEEATKGDRTTLPSTPEPAQSQ